VVKSHGPEDLVFQSVAKGAPMRDNSILVRHKAPRPDFNSYETDIKRAGFVVVDEEWPKLPRRPSVYEKRGVLNM
jgi:hypothetical protein